jgi:hypothetical protein
VETLFVNQGYPSIYTEQNPKCLTQITALGHSGAITPSISLKFMQFISCNSLDTAVMTGVNCDASSIAHEPQQKRCKTYGDQNFHRSNENVTSQTRVCKSGAGSSLLTLMLDAQHHIAVNTTAVMQRIDASRSETFLLRAVLT